jgi:hypothetical protein
LHVRLDLITGDLLLLGDSIRYIESEIRPLVQSQPGSLGTSLHADPERGALVAESFWASRDALLDSEPIVAPSRDEAVRRAKGTAAVERYEVPVFEREAPFGAGAGVRLTRRPAGARRPPRTPLARRRRPRSSGSTRTGADRRSPPARPRTGRSGRQAPTPGWSGRSPRRSLRRRCPPSPTCSRSAGCRSPIRRG